MKKIFKLVSGVGINDADYRTTQSLTDINGKQTLIWRCPFYTVWCNMLTRCYSDKYQDRNLRYKGCTVCDEWLTFSNFKAWMETQDWEAMSLDKDILVSSNKIYAPDRCVFITRITNSFVVECNSVRGEFPIGVYWCKKASKYAAQCRNPFTRKREGLGYYDDIVTAHYAWLARKLELAKLLAAEQKDTRVAAALIARYENYV